MGREMSEQFGLFAKDQRLKVTNEVKSAGQVLIIPCSMGFKQKDGTWVNEWVDCVVFAGGLYDIAQSIQKGEQITVGGRLTMKQWKDKKSWQILCDDLSVSGSQSHGKGEQPDQDVPF
jgi:single-stranded DNA-binding protein